MSEYIWFAWDLKKIKVYLGVGQLLVTMKNSDEYSLGKNSDIKCMCFMCILKYWYFIAYFYHLQNCFVSNKHRLFCFIWKLFVSFSYMYRKCSVSVFIIVDVIFLLQVISWLLLMRTRWVWQVSLSPQVQVYFAPEYQLTDFTL